MTYFLPIILAIIAAFVVGISVGMFSNKKIVDKKLTKAHMSAQDILEDAKRQAQTSAKEAILEAREKRRKA